MNDSSRYIMAIVLAMIILFTWQILFPVEQPIYEQENRQETLLDEIVISEANNIIPEAVATCNSEKIIIDNERLEGSIDLCGAQIIVVCRRNCVSQFKVRTLTMRNEEH